MTSRAERRAAAKLIPVDVHAAAKRGFLRTAAQSLATGFVVPAGLTFAVTGDYAAALGLGLAGAVVNALVNGAQSYFDILGRGIPADYSTVR